MLKNKPFREFAQRHFISETGEILELDGSEQAKKAVEKRKLSKTRSMIRTTKGQLSSVKKATIYTLKAKGRSFDVLKMRQHMDKLQARIDSLKESEKRSVEILK